MAINLLYSNEMEGKAITSILEKKGYHVNRFNRYDLNYQSTDPSHRKSIFIIETKYLQKSEKKLLDKLCKPKNYIVLVGTLNHLYWFFKINSSLSCFILKNEKIDTLDFAIKKLTDDKSFFSEKVKGFLKKGKHKQHEILLKQNLSSYLTITELETMFQIATGKTTKQIAEDWNRSHHTINNHRKNILKKIGLKGPFRLTKFCLDKKDQIQTLISLSENEKKVKQIIKNN